MIPTYAAAFLAKLHVELRKYDLHRMACTNKAFIYLVFPSNFTVLPYKTLPLGARPNVITGSVDEPTYCIPYSVQQTSSGFYRQV